MRNFTLFLAAFITGTSLSFGQCNPDPQFTTIGFHPDSATGLAIGCEGVPYTQVITIVSIVDTTVNVPPFGPITIPIDSVIIDGVIGLPAGLTYDCEMPGCTWYPGTNATSCIQFTGTPGAGSSGDYPVVINYTAHFTLLGSPQSFPLFTNYSLTIEDCAGLEDLAPLNATLVKITDLSGREVQANPGIALLYHYSDGSVRKVVNLQD